MRMLSHESKKGKKGMFALLAAVLVAGSLQASAFAADKPNRISEEKSAAPKIMAKSMSLLASDGVVVQGALTPEELIGNLLGSGVTVSNISYRGNDVSAGTFTGGDGIVGFESGIVLSTGSIHNVPGPNYSDSIGTGNDQPGDADLDSLLQGYTTQDATVLEFDFVPDTNVLSFQYVFASEEYNEYVEQGFNDVFGFFLNGVNVATLPDGTPVTIDNINLNSNSDLYINNDASDITPTVNIEMDGLTKVLSVEANVNPGVTNHMKLAIADVGDSIYDSNIFLRANSFAAEPVGDVEFSSVSYEVDEAGVAAVITVNRVNGTNGDITVDYSTSNGTATEGIDYAAASGTLTLLSGETSKTFTVPVTDDSEIEGDETISLALANPTGGASLGAIVQATLTIKDNDKQQEGPGVLEFELNEITVDEAIGQALVKVIRTGGASGDVSATYCFCNANATKNVDYTGVNGKVTFADGQTEAFIAIPIIDDNLQELKEMFKVYLKDATGGASLGKKYIAWITIQDND